MRGVLMREGLIQFEALQELSVCVCVCVCLCVCVCVCVCVCEIPSKLCLTLGT